MKKNSFSLSLKNITILAGVCVILLSVSIYASSQNKKSYRSVNNSTTVGYENNSTIFNANKIEEHGDCKIVTANTCGKDVFIPTNTSPERTAFKDNYPTCITLADCPNSCVLKEFVNRVYAGTPTYSKVRNIVNGYIKDYGSGSENTGYINDDFVIGYGEDFAVSLATGYDNKPKIVSQDSIANGISGYSGFSLYEFELYGISPETENTNRGCFDDGSYRVNSNVSSFWTSHWEITSLFSGVFDSPLGDRYFAARNIWGSLNSQYSTSNGRSYNTKFFGCKSELLPNPDRYCIERVINASGVAVSSPNAIYIKDFTNNYKFTYAGCDSSPNGTDTCLTSRVNICSSISGIADGLQMRILSTGDIITGGIYTKLTPQPITPTTTSITKFYYRNNLTGSYGTNVFGFYYKNNVGTYKYIPGNQIIWTVANNPFVNDGFFNYISGLDLTLFRPSGFDMYWRANPPLWIGGNTNTPSMLKIPLLEENQFLGLIDNNPTAGGFQSKILSASDIAANSDYNANRTKHVCVGYTCNPGYSVTSTGCVCDNPVGNSCDVGGVLIANPAEEEVGPSNPN